MERNTTERKGVSLFTTIQINFLILKLAGLVDWSWLWVLAPAWIPILLMTMIWIPAKLYEQFNK